MESMADATSIDQLINKARQTQAQDQAKLNWLCNLKATQTDLLNEIKNRHNTHYNELQKVFEDNKKRIEKQYEDEKRHIEKRRDDKLKQLNTKQNDLFNELNKHKNLCTQKAEKKFEKLVLDGMKEFHNMMQCNYNNPLPQLESEPIGMINQCTQQTNITQNINVSTDDMKQSLPNDTVQQNNCTQVNLSLNDREQSQSNVSNLMDEDNVIDPHESVSAQLSNLANISTDTTDTTDSGNNTNSMVRRTSMRKKVVCICKTRMNSAVKTGIHNMDNDVINCEGDGCTTVIKDEKTVFYCCENFRYHQCMYYLCEKCAQKTIHLRTQMSVPLDVVRKNRKKIKGYASTPGPCKQSRNNKNKRHDCGWCGKKFSVSTNFYAHVRTHTGEKPFKCHTCSKRFTQKIQLQQHQKRCINKCINKILCS